MTLMEICTRPLRVKAAIVEVRIFEYGFLKLGANLKNAEHISCSF